GAYIQYMDERMGLGPRSFTVETVIQASLLFITTAIGFAFAMKRMIPQHRQWMTRNYAAALTFFEIRLILGVMGWDDDIVLTETVVWSCTACAILVGDIANQIYELQSMRPRRARMPASVQPMPADEARLSPPLPTAGLDPPIQRPRACAANRCVHAIHP